MSVKIFRIVLPIVLVLFVTADCWPQELVEHTEQITAQIESGSYQQAKADTAVLITDFNTDEQLPESLFSIAKTFQKNKKLEDGEQQ